MLNDYRYKLEPYTGRNSRYTCPGCRKQNQFTRYIDAITGDHVANNIGICNRVNKCGYHYAPKQYFHETGISYPVLAHGDPYGQGKDFLPGQMDSTQRTGEPIPHGNIELKIFKKSLSNYDKNNFIQYLHTRFDSEKINKLIKDYHIGTSSRWDGGTTIFWQVDISGNIRTGKLIKYNTLTGKRYKNKTNWVHSVMQLPGFNLKQCFFGEHLLGKYPHKPVGLVESEKTAIIASSYFPELVWLASGGANNMNIEKVKALRTREVILFPDASSSGEIYYNWCEIAKKYGFTCSEFIEKNATNVQKEKGIDIADLLESVSIKGNTSIKPIIPSPFNTNPSINKLVDTFGFREVKVTPLYKWKKEPFTYPKATPQIPYNTPSPVAVIDSKIDTKKVFNKEDLVVKSRVFTTTSGDNIKLVGLRDYGFCKNWESHKKQKGHCKECILNCLHTIKISGKLQKREYSQLEILLIQESQINTNTF